MAIYSTVTTLVDPALSNLSEDHCLGADVFVDLQLRARGFDPALVILPNAALTAIAEAWAKRLAATEGALGEDSPLIAKAREHEKTALTLVNLLTREGLGLSVVGVASFGTVTLGRG